MNISKNEKVEKNYDHEVSTTYMVVDTSTYAAAGGVRSGLHRFLRPAHVEADGLIHTRNIMLLLVFARRLCQAAFQRVPQLL